MILILKCVYYVKFLFVTFSSAFNPKLHGLLEDDTFIYASSKTKITKLGNS